MAAADQEARFAIDIQAKGAKDAEDLESTLRRLRETIRADQAALTDMQAALRRMQQGGNVSSAAFAQLRDQIAAKRAALASAQETYVQLGGTFGRVQRASEETSSAMTEVTEAVEEAQAPAGGLSGLLGQLTQRLGKVGMAGAALALAAAVAVLVAGLVAATAALSSFALAAADSTRSLNLLFDAVNAGSGADQRLAVQVELLAARVALARSQLNDMALALGRTRLQGRALEAAFSAVATTTAVMGQAAGATLQGIAAQAARTRVFVLNAFSLDGTGLQLADVGRALARRMGVSFQAAMAAIQSGRVRVEEGLEALDDAVRAKFGKIAAAQLLGFGVQLTRARENIAGLFSDVQIEPFLRGLQGVLRLFDQNTVSGRALKVVIEGLLNPLFEAVGRASPYVQAFFKGLIIAALVVLIGVLRLKKAFEDTFGGGTKSKIDGIRLAVYAGIATMGALVVTVGLLAAAIALSLAPLGALMAAATLVGVVLVTPFALAGLAVYGLYIALKAAYDAIKGLDFGQLAADLVDGFVGGVRNGIAKVVSAVSELGRSAISALRSVLDEHSPSRVAARSGMNFRLGFTQEIEAGTADAKAASRGLGAAAVDGLEGGAAPGRVGVAATAGGNTYNINIYGVKDADEMTALDFARRVAEAIEGAALSAGVGLMPEGA